MSRSLRQLLLERETELGVSVSEAAKLAGLNVRQYQGYRNSGVSPQGPQRKRLIEGLGLEPQDLNAAIEELEVDEGAGEAYVKWLGQPASREDVQKLEAKMFDIERELREVRKLLETGGKLETELRNLLDRAKQMRSELDQKEEQERSV